MICTHVELTMDTLEARDIAKAMLKFWLYQSEQARQSYKASSLKVEHAYRANEEAKREWKESDDFGFGPTLPFSETEIENLRANLLLLRLSHTEWKESDDFGFGPTLPFSETEIENLRKRLPALEKNLDEANAMAGYFINFITDKAHSEKELDINA